MEADERSFADEFLRGRAGQSLAHVFTLLSLVLPATPLQIAYRGLHTTDPGLRGTALEYLEGVLPHDIRDRLWPFLDDRPRRRGDGRARDEILADLLRSNESIVLNLEELRRRDARKDRITSYNVCYTKLLRRAAARSRGRRRTTRPPGRSWQRP